MAASAEADALLDGLERLTNREWLTVHQRIQQISGPQWGRISSLLSDMVSEARLQWNLSDAVWDKLLAEFQRQHNRSNEIVEKLPKSAAGDGEYRAKISHAIRTRLATMRTHEFLQKTDAGRRALAMITALFERFGSPRARDAGSASPVETNEGRTPRPAVQRPRDGVRRVSAAYSALVAALKRIEARFEQPGRYVATHGEELFNELFLMLDGVVENGGVRHYLENPSGDGAERAKAYLAEIGAWPTLTVLDDVSENFPGRVIPAAQHKRTAILEVADKRMKNFNDPLRDADARYRDAQRNLHECLAKYVRENPREFPRQ